MKTCPTSEGDYCWQRLVWDFAESTTDFLRRSATSLSLLGTRPTMTNAPIPAASSRPRRRRFARRAMSWLALLGLAAVLVVMVVRVSLWRAVVALHQRQHETAQRWVSAAAALNWLPGLKSDRAETIYLQAKVWRRLGQLERVGPALRQAQQLGFDVALLEREEAYALAQDGQFQKLGARWGRLIVDSGSDAPELADAYVTFCLARFRFAEAENALKSWSADFPEDFRPYRQRGQIHFVMQNWGECVVALEQATRRAPQDVSSRLLKAQAHLKQLQFEDADRELAVVLATDPNHAEALILRATCWSHRGETDQARAALRTVLEHEPNRFSALRELGLLELKLGHHQSAVEAFERALPGHEEDAELRQALAKALTASGRAGEAEPHFAFMEAASKSLLSLPQLTTRLASEPANVELRFEVAQIVWKYRSRSEGLLWLKSTLEFAPTHAGTHALLAEHYRWAGNHELAEQHARMAERE